ncbi:MAG: hypothetical protein ACHQT8_04225 [Chlamydiales bacterium]
MGASQGDYQMLCRHLNQAPPLPESPHFTDESTRSERQAYASELQAAWERGYAQAQEAASGSLANLADVYCFQEVATEERPFMRAFPQERFARIHLQNAQAFDTAILLDRERFREITHHSMNVLIQYDSRGTNHWQQDVAIATAIDRLTDQRVTFVSAHTPGFNFTINPLNTNTCPELANGDRYCIAIANRLKEIGGSKIEVIGCDMNANPERWNARFQIFSDFQVNRNGTATNVNAADGRILPGSQEREIDFILTRVITSIWQRIKAFFCSYIVNTAAIHHYNPFTWDHETNCSDHLPVFIHVTSTRTSSKLHQLFSYIISCFRPTQANAPEGTRAG